MAPHGAHPPSVSPGPKKPATHEHVLLPAAETELGGQGVQAIAKSLRGGRVVASFPIDMDDQIMLVTDAGQSIRCPVAGISFRSRSAGGVKVFNTAEGEKVVSVAWIAEQGEDEDQDG